MATTITIDPTPDLSKRRPTRRGPDLDVDLAQGDIVTLPFAIVDQDGAAQDLTGATVTFKLTRYSGQIPLAKAMTITDAAGGLAQVDLTATETADPGGFRARIEVLFASGKQASSAEIGVRIRPKL